MNSLIKEDEILEKLDKVSMEIIQKKEGFRFGVDAIILSNFVELANKSNVLEIGTGTGIISLLLSNSYPNAKISAVEIQENMADMAGRSVFYNKLENNITVINKDIKELESSSSFDYIVSNPPYMPIKQGKISSNKIKAISRHEIKLNLKDLLIEGKRLLKVGGSLSIIYRTNRFYELLNLLETYSFSPKRLRFIYSKEGSESILFMIELVKAKKTPLSILEPLYIFDSKGNYTKELQSYY